MIFTTGLLSLALFRIIRSNIRHSCHENCLFFTVDYYLIERENVVRLASLFQEDSRQKEKEREGRDQLKRFFD